MTAMDKITEEIAHFIGMFQLNAERAIQRDAYDDFLARKPVNPDLPAPDLDKLPFAAPYDFLGYDPGVKYMSPGPDLIYVPPWKLPLPQLPFTPFDLEPSGFPQPPWHTPDGFSAVAPARTVLPPEPIPPGSVVTYINQTILLSDNDYFSVGGHGLVFSPNPVSIEELLDAAGYAYSQSPIGDLERPGSSAEIIETIKQAGTQLKDFVADQDGPFEIFAKQADTIEGIYVNGELVDEAPKLKDYYEFEDDKDKDEDEDGDTWTANVTIGKDGTYEVKASVTLTAGDNTLVNEAILKNLWAGATVTAVVGDYVEVNAIVQVNALWNVDKITADIGSWSTNGTVDQVFNIAEFERIDSSTDDDSSDADVGGFPKYWSVTKIDGDLLMVNWLEQFIFKSDNDIGILSSSGVTTSVISGGNLGVNQTNILELGFSYDLIIVGGSVYDANLIQQINVLCDNDVVGALPGFQTTGTGTASSGGNLLWNEAYIGNIGDSDGFEALPANYLATAKGLENGGNSISKGVLTDDAFTGLEGLRVLYIKGDLLNLQYIKQTSVLGDSDQIALAMDQLKPHLDADWSVSTGGNTLVNHAAILDLDSLGKTYVGGEKYSQETLIQAELISNKPDFGSPDPNALVSEAVLFLDDSMLESTHEAAPGVYLPSAHEGQTDDGLQHLLGH
ncbi:hypothetical protein IB238_21925 [Rhizobium sp. ARZ01]|uniref:hypothetical protein n=1 Tax=Rhizobium sp. ARZ01 TaxID=2769313 RepID=UPI0017806206|nr:hypothetical protein [Rhizobium sp. ARZ01]MBD9375284.1 hypothetical protein [Rhizobium sp. ARZ01]